MLPDAFPHETKRGMRPWLWLAVMALAVAGLFSLLLVLARAPFFQAFIPFRDFFHSALVVHVNLSVLVWTLSIGAVLWSSLIPPSLQLVSRFSAGAVMLGSLVMAVSAFFPNAAPLMNNYVPVIVHPLFVLGLSFIGGGITVFTLTVLLTAKPDRDAMRFGIWSSALIAAAALLAFTLSYHELRLIPLAPGDFYEHLFWGGGHMLQLAYSQIMVMAWFMLASIMGIVSLNSKLLYACFTAGLVVSLPGLAAYVMYPVDSAGHRQFFTDHMIAVGGIAPLMALLVLVSFLLKKRNSTSFPGGASAPNRESSNVLDPRLQPAVGSRMTSECRPLRNALISSIVLFLAGGVLGFMIHGSNVTIPAHYHGSIVGVTLALMGLAYALLPRLGYREPAPKLASLQPLLYGGGQFLHIIGLAWSGGYGALRKSPGVAPTFEAQLGMGLMGIGGLIAIIGGLLFVVITLQSMLKRTS